MSNRDGKGAKRRGGFGELKAGDLCPKCNKGIKKKNRSVTLDSDGNAAHTPSKPIKLTGCGDRSHANCNHASCTKCGWINY